MFDKEKITIDLGGKAINLMIIKNVNELLNNIDSEEDIPFWAELWPSAIALGRHLWNNSNLKGARILELGAGIGLPGIVAAIKGAQVTQTDFKREALDIASENARLNQVQIRTLIEDWRNFSLKERFDFIIGSDVLYEPTLHVYLNEIINNNLVKNGQVIFADPGREPAAAFIQKMSEDGWSVQRKQYNVSEKKLNYNITINTLN